MCADELKERFPMLRELMRPNFEEFLTGDLKSGSSYIGNRLIDACWL
jgi:hypothetical protein